MQLTVPVRLTKISYCWLSLKNLAHDDVIIPGTVNLSFNIELCSTADLKRTFSEQHRQGYRKETGSKVQGNEILSIDDFDIFACYRDLWKTKLEKRDVIRQGIISNDGCMKKCIKLRI